MAVVGMIDVAKSSWLVMSGEEPLRASVTGAGGWVGGGSWRLVTPLILCRLQRESL